jgi:hypothetical protein
MSARWFWTSEMCPTTTFMTLFSSCATLAIPSPSTLKRAER